MNLSLKEKTEQVFKEHFDTEPAYCFRAPGRVNLIGEHTDYNDGFVLPCAINYDTVIAAAPRNDNQVSVVAADYSGQASHFRLDGNIPHDQVAPWSNYVRGVAWSLIQQEVVPKVEAAIAKKYPAASGLEATVYVCQASAGAREC